MGDWHASYPLLPQNSGPAAFGLQQHQQNLDSQIVPGLANNAGNLSLEQPMHQMAQFRLQQGGDMGHQVSQQQVLSRPESVYPLGHLQPSTTRQQQQQAQQPSIPHGMPQNQMGQNGLFPSGAHDGAPGPSQLFGPQGNGGMPQQHQQISGQPQGTPTMSVEQLRVHAQRLRIWITKMEGEANTMVANRPPNKSEAEAQQEVNKIREDIQQKKQMFYKIVAAVQQMSGGRNPRALGVSGGPPGGNGPMMPGPSHSPHNGQTSPAWMPPAGTPQVFSTPQVPQRVLQYSPMGQPPNVAQSPTARNGSDIASGDVLLVSQPHQPQDSPRQLGVNQATTSAEARLEIERLDKDLDVLQPGTLFYGQKLRELQRTCEHSGLLPMSCCINDSDIELEEPEAIFKSALSDVYIGRQGSTRVALKALRISKHDFLKTHKAFAKEVIVWKRLSHPNIVPFLGASYKRGICLLSVWMPNKSARMYLEENSSHRRTPWLVDICAGLQYMHDMHIVHGDLKGANIVIDKSLHACLIDFGLATVMHHTGDTTSMMSTPGTVRWMPPELLSPDENDKWTLANEASDLYSLAMTFWELFAVKDPFYAVTGRHVTWALTGMIVRGGRPSRPDTADPDGVNDALWDIMQKCWSHVPSTRPALSEVLRVLSSVPERSDDNR